MNETTLIINNLTLNTNYSIDTCSLNQFEMLNQVQRLPKLAYWFLLTALIILLIYMLIPKIKEYISADKIIYPVFMLILTSIFFYTLLTFNITSELYKSILEPILYIICGIGIIYIIIKERKKIKEIYIKLREE